MSVGIKVSYGSATVKINGRINENVYSDSLFDERVKDEKYYDNPLVAEGTISKNEIKYLSTGEEYTFSVLPSEVVTINVTSWDGGDVTLIVQKFGDKREYTVKGSNAMGLFLSFQNR